mgnify:CR=1 FL=1
MALSKLETLPDFLMVTSGKERTCKLPSLMVFPLKISVFLLETKFPKLIEFAFLSKNEPLIP